MNYMSIVRSDGRNDPSEPKMPPTVVQMFTDADMTALAGFVQEAINDKITNHNHEGLVYELGFKAAHTFINLMSMWEVKTQ